MLSANNIDFSRSETRAVAHILVVEDAAFFARATKKRLERARHQCTVAADLTRAQS